MSISLDKMSLMRAFTTKRNRGEGDGTQHSSLGRAASQRAGRPVLRAQISSPVALLSTSNSLYVNAADIPGTLPVENVSSTSSNSGEESDASMLSLDTANITEASSIEASPVTPEPQPNHLSCYFKPAVDTTSTNPTPSISRQPSFESVPAVPQRMPSHSKKAHEKVHRKRSVQRMMSPAASIRSSMDMFGPGGRGPAVAETSTDGPFGNELAQLDAVAEELASAVDDAQADADAAYMEKLGLATFAASDYLAEIQSLMAPHTAEIERPIWI